MIIEKALASIIRIIVDNKLNPDRNLSLNNVNASKIKNVGIANLHSFHFRELNLIIKCVAKKQSNKDAPISQTIVI